MNEPSRQRILVVEDEESIRKGLCDVLAFHGYAPEGVERGDDGYARARANRHALVILDVMLPGMDGFEICRRLRDELPRLPILLLTARGAEGDVLDGFRCGADDYVTKPFSVSELVARVEALLRRARAAHGEGPCAPFTIGGFEVDPESLVALRGAIRVELTRREVDLLAVFARDAGRIVSRRQLLQEVWGMPEPERIETRTVDMHIAKLRKKLGPEGAGVIETVRGEGYRFGG